VLQVQVLVRTGWMDIYGSALLANASDTPNIKHLPEKNQQVDGKHANGDCQHDHMQLLATFK